MRITAPQLYAALERLEPWHMRATVWRKLPNGKIVRFVDWKSKTKGTYK